MGQAEFLELMTATQLPQKLHASITGQSTELICFRLGEQLAPGDNFDETRSRKIYAKHLTGRALGAVRELGMNYKEVQVLPLRQFIAKNRLSGSRVEGRVF